jgi:PAS domain-containing protein
MAEMLKYDSPEDLNGHALFDFIHPEDVEQVRAQLKTGSSRKDPQRYEVRLQCRDGSIRWASVKVANVLDERARLLGRMALFLDITEHRRLQQALRESEGRLQALADSLPRLEKMARVMGIFFKKYGNPSLPST